MYFCFMNAFLLYSCISLLVFEMKAL